MRRTLEEWRGQLRETVNHARDMGFEWALVTLLFEVALILLDIREALVELGKDQ
jgi:hypothetical protein